MNCRLFVSLIDFYLRGELSEAECSEFEKHYFTCDGCFTQLQIQSLFIAKDVRVHLPEKKRAFVFRPAFVFPSLLGLLLLGLVATHFINIRYYDRLSRFTPPPFMGGELRAGPGDASLPRREKQFRRAMDLYSRLQYPGALAILQRLRSEDPAVPKVDFFTAVCLLLTDEPESALELFDGLIKEMNPAYYDEAIYYKGMALLKMHDKTRALVQFRNLEGMISPMATPAREMVRRLSE